MFGITYTLLQSDIIHCCCYHANCFYFTYLVATPFLTASRLLLFGIILLLIIKYIMTSKNEVT